MSGGFRATTRALTFRRASFPNRLMTVANRGEQPSIRTVLTDAQCVCRPRESRALGSAPALTRAVTTSGVCRKSSLISAAAVQRCSPATSTVQFGARVGVRAGVDEGRDDLRCQGLNNRLNAAARCSGRSPVSGSVPPPSAFCRPRRARWGPRRCQSRSKKGQCPGAKLDTWFDLGAHPGACAFQIADACQGALAAGQPFRSFGIFRITVWRFCSGATGSFRRSSRGYGRGGLGDREWHL